MLYKPKYFSSKEFYDIEKMSPMLLFILDTLRGSFGRKYAKVSFNINFSNNPKDKHAPNSKHYTNDAVDMHIKAYYDNKKTLPASYNSIVEDIILLLRITTIWDNTGIGIYPEWNTPGFHIDFSPHKHREWMAWYEDGKQVYGELNYNKIKELTKDA